MLFLKKLEGNNLTINHYQIEKMVDDKKTLISQGTCFLESNDVVVSVRLAT